MLLLYVLISGQSVDLKMRRLEYIQSLLDQKRQQIEAMQEELEDLSRDRESYEADYEQKLNDLEILQAEEQVITRTLRESEQRMELSKAELDQMSDLWCNQFRQYIISQHTSNASREDIIDKQYLPLIIVQTKEKIDENQEFLDAVLQNIEKNRVSQQRIREQRNRESRIANEYVDEISRLDNRITALTEDEQEIYREFQSLEESRRNLETMIAHFQAEGSGAALSYEFTTDRLIWPLRGEVISSFGEVHDEYHNISILNNGIDIQSSEADEVRAVDFGVVVFAEAFKNYGKLIIIDHQNGYFSLYGNNGNLLVTRDEVVSLGQTIGVAGRNNGSDSYLLHFELRRHSKPVDPLAYLE
jgi:septal ring factor EnvC (AmiA/AmiB activator)